MHATEYIPLALRTAKWFSGPGPDMTAIHAALGLMSEAGELSEVFLAEEMGTLLHHHGTDYRSAKLEELGGFAWFLVYAMHHHADAIHAGLGIRINAAALLYGELNLQAALPPGHRWITMVNGSENDLLPWAAGEYGTLVKATAVYGKPMNVEQLYRCLSLMAAALRNAARFLGVDLSEVYDYNINQLRARYPDKFTDELAIARLDKQGLESEGGVPD